VVEHERQGSAEGRILDLKKIGGIDRGVGIAVDAGLTGAWRLDARHRHVADAEQHGAGGDVNRGGEIHLIDLAVTAYQQPVG